MKLDLAELRRVANACGPCDCDSFACSNMLEAAFADFIAAFDPETCLKLLDAFDTACGDVDIANYNAYCIEIERDRLKQELAAAKAEIERLRNLVQKDTWYGRGTE